MQRKFYTLDDLYQFCKTNKFEHFSAKEAGAPLVVQAFGFFEATEEDDQGLVPVSLKVCHTSLNRNKSFISDAVMNKRLSTLYNRPILGYIHETEDGWDFYDHRMSIVEDGDDARVEYEERPIGIFPESCNPHLEYDEKEDKNYVVANGLIYADYGNRAYDIIKSKGGETKVSAEICVLEMSFNAKENYLSIDDFYFSGCTCLGKTPDGTVVEEGMKGSKLSLKDFGATNSIFCKNTDYQKLLVDTLERLNTTLSTFSYEKNNKGGKVVNKLEELLAKYEVTIEELDFETEGLDDEALETAFEEFICRRKKKCDMEDGDETTPAVDPELEPKADPEAEEKFSKTFAVELSHEDVSCALYNLISQYDEIDNDYYFIRNVYDNYFIMQAWCTGKIYKQNYIVEDTNVSLSGERQEMFELIVSESEKLTIEKLRGDYAELEAKYNELAEFKANYDAAILKAQKDEILSKAEYSVLAEDTAFKTLVADAAKFSVAEIETKCKEIFADYVIKTGKFSAQPEDKPTIKTIGIPYNMKEKKKAAYGGLFLDK